MKLNTIDKLNIKGKKILLRVDLNSDVVNRKVLESERIKAHAKTIRYFLKKDAKVVVIAHQGSPEKKDCMSLKQHSVFLNKYVRIKFVKEVIGKRVWMKISGLKDGEAILLENVRFLKDEFNPSINNSFVNFIKEAEFDYYVNDAFSICHRNQTSIVSFPKILPSFAGPVLKEEFEHIQKLKSKLKNCLFILGGTKSKDLITLLKNKKILTGGKLSILSLNAQGYNLPYENKDSVNEIKKYLKNMTNPIDLAVKINGKRKEFFVWELPKKYPVLDIGQATIEIYRYEIKKAKAIFFKGAMGVFEEKQFAEGTREILKAIGNSPAFSVIAGGQSSDAINKFKLNKKKFGYVSLSGGALVHYLAGNKLPGLEVLK